MPRSIGSVFVPLITVATSKDVDLLFHAPWQRFLAGVFSVVLAYCLCPLILCLLCVCVCKSSQETMKVVALVFGGFLDCGVDGVLVVVVNVLKKRRSLNLLKKVSKKVVQDTLQCKKRTRHDVQESFPRNLLKDFDRGQPLISTSFCQSFTIYYSTRVCL